MLRIMEWQYTMESGALRTWKTAAIPAGTAHLNMKKKYTASLFKPLLFRVFLLFIAIPNPTRHIVQMEGLLMMSMGPISHHVKQIKTSYIKYKLQITLQGTLKSRYLVSIIYTLQTFIHLLALILPFSLYFGAN